ncbi:glycoside hydrolase family 99-like domain-containing protein [Nonomuraea sp. K274]|uniref:Glycoside hydrolase family 99-like domain-containing protein n=1 Tax=Nonomuraea cypriaca TaxID=1187855 RepID=A0A931EYQ4_9ACTN|nr:glycoside hydrolase family 99-like domain-containing protein [Nonomuraea cypriaca]MBF8184298.1 glycoside hydrolase family 99-like domain-containing protein [Nonomuraea cypriaca]
MTVPNQDAADPHSFAGAVIPASAPRPALPGDRTVQVLAYYYPQWHTDPTNDLMFEPGWTEWGLLRKATPRYPGHYQPKVPAWGYADEADPGAATRIVDTALTHGLTGFVVDWYWYDNHPFLNRALDDGLLHAERVDELRFALMWANHEWLDIYPARDPTSPALLPAPNTRYHARNAFRHVIDRYLHHPSYWRLDGAPYFSLYDVPSFVRGMGGVDAAADMLAEFRAMAGAAGIPRLHLNGVTTFNIDDTPAMAARLGFDTVTHYTWWHHPDAGFDTFPTADYRRVLDRARAVWDEFSTSLNGRYLPNVTMGWDPSPRTVDWPMDKECGYPFTSILTGNTPEAFGTAVRDAVRHARTHAQHPAVLVNAWNEWTEGSYLEPDDQHGLAYLEAIRSAIEGAAS